ncbi:MAG: hypothetical protein VYB74_05875 [Cyanobacteriota bacterium]|nr:hypothetical protein [Cyanobacteriota bacterium]
MPAFVRASAGLDPDTSVPPVVHDPLPSFDELPQKLSQLSVSAASQGVADKPNVQTSRDGRFEKLENLMRWRKEGLADSPELKAAKRELLGLYGPVRPVFDCFFFRDVRYEPFVCLSLLFVLSAGLWVPPASDKFPAECLKKSAIIVHFPGTVGD